jgi:hypothetical protein
MILINRMIRHRKVVLIVVNSLHVERVPYVGLLPVTVIQEEFAVETL